MLVGLIEEEGWDWHCCVTRVEYENKLVIAERVGEGGGCMSCRGCRGWECLLKGKGVGCEMKDKGLWKEDGIIGGIEGRLGRLD